MFNPGRGARAAAPLALLTLLAGAATTALAPAAGAATPSATVTGAATPLAKLPGSEQVTYTIAVSSGTVNATVLQVDEPAGLPADPASVLVDGATAPAGTVSNSGTQLVVRLGAGADASSGGDLATGSHTVAFGVPETAQPKASASSSATLTYQVGGAASTATSGAVALGAADLALAIPEGSGEGQTAPLGSGVDADYEAILTNTGTATAAATLTITLPAGLTVDEDLGVYRDDDYQSDEDDGGVPLTCKDTAQAVTCALGSLPTGVTTMLDIPLAATPSAPIGKTATFTVSALADNGVDANLGDNRLSGSVLFTGVANLVVTLSAPTHRVVLGKTVAVTVTVHNQGPQPALETISLLGLDNPLDKHFDVVGFSGKHVQFPGFGGSGGALTFTSEARPARLSRIAAAADPQQPPIVAWEVDTLRSGASASAVLTLKAKARGTSKIEAFAVSAAGDTECADATSPQDCPAFATLTLSAVAAPPATSGSGNPIANTAAIHPEQLGSVGLLAVLAGLLLLVAGRRPVRARHRKG